MKRMAALLLAMSLLPGGVLAGGDGKMTGATPAPTARPAPLAPVTTVPPEAGVYPQLAVIAPQGETAPLYAVPNANGEVLMGYYPGVRVTAIRKALPGFVQVQVGGETAGLLGYMREADLRFGSAALREVEPMLLKLEMNRQAEVYAYCDANAEHLGVCAPEGEYYAIGKRADKWVQLGDPGNDYLSVETRDGWHDPAPDARMGFVQLETGMARGYETRPLRWLVEPLPGEITKEAALELAVETLYALTDDDGAWALPAHLRDRDVLRAQAWTVTWTYSAPGSGFRQLAVRVECDTDAYTMFVNMDAQGTVFGARYERGNG